MTFLDPVFNPVLLPLVQWNPFLAIIVLSLAITLLVTLVYKYFTNQEEMKRLKEQQKEFQKQMKELRDTPGELMKLQKEAMQVNMQYMKHSFKATLITMLPILLIFGWMNAHLTFVPLTAGEAYPVAATFAEETTGDAELVADESTSFALDERTGKVSEVKQPVQGATWYLKSLAGEHLLQVKFNEVTQSKKVVVSKDLVLVEPVSLFRDSPVQRITVGYEKLKPLSRLFSTPEKEAHFKLLGWEPGWLGLYIIFSLVFSLGLRKLLKIY